MRVYINSSSREIPKEIDTVSKLLDYMKVSKTGTGVGVNNRLVPSRDWDFQRLEEDDRITVITAAYGG